MLESPLTSLFAQVAALGSFYLACFPTLLAQWCRCKWWFAFSRRALPEFSPGVKVGEVSLSFTGFLFSILLRHPSPAIDMLSDGLCLFSCVSIIPPLTTQ